MTRSDATIFILLYFTELQNLQRKAAHHVNNRSNVPILFFLSSSFFVLFKIQVNKPIKTYIQYTKKIYLAKN